MICFRSSMQYRRYLHAPRKLSSFTATPNASTHAPKKLFSFTVTPNPSNRAPKKLSSFTATPNPSNHAPMKLSYLTPTPNPSNCAPMKLSSFTATPNPSKETFPTLHGNFSPLRQLQKNQPSTARLAVKFTYDTVSFNIGGCRLPSRPVPP